MAAPPPMLTLVVEKGPRKGETRKCSAGAALRVGRVVKGNDLAVRDGGTSQQHLVIKFLPPPAAGWAVSDLESSNGTLLNGNSLAPSVPAPLSHGDLIKVGESTVLAVSIAPDSDPKPVVNPSSGRFSRHAAAEAPMVVEEKPPAATRRGVRKKAPPAAQHTSAQKEDPEAEAVAVDEKPQVVLRRGGRKKLPAAESLCEMEGTVEAPRGGEQRKTVGPSESENDKEEEATLVTHHGRRKNVVEPSEPEKKEEATVVTRRGRRKNVAEPPEPEKGKEEATVVTRRGRRKNVAEPPEPQKEKEEEAIVVTCRGRRKNVAEPPESEKKEEEEATVVTNFRGRKKNAVTDAPPPLPPKMRAVRGRGKRASASDMVLEDDKEEQGENELAVSRACPEAPLISMPLKGVKVQKRDKVASGDGEVEGAVVALEEKVPKERASAQLAEFDYGANVAVAEPIKEMEQVVDATIRGRRKKDVEPDEPEKDVQEVAMVVTRRGRRKKNMQPHEPEKDVLEEAMVVTCRGRRKKNMEPHEPEKEEEEEKEDKAPGVMHHGATKKNAAAVAPAPLPPKRKSARGRGRLTRASPMNTVLEEEKEEEEEQGGNKLGASRACTRKPSKMIVKKGDKAAPVDEEVKRTAKASEEKLSKGRAAAKLAASNNISYAAASEPTEEMGEGAEGSHYGGRKAMELPELEKEEDATMVTRRGERKRPAVVKRRAAGKKDVVPVTRSGRGRGRGTRASARNNILEEEDMVVEKENEVPVPREQAGSPPVPTAVNGDEDYEVKRTTKAMEDELPKGRASAQSSSHNKGEEEQGGANGSSRVDSGSNGIPNTTSKYREDRKLKAYSTPFEIRLDRALKKYSA